jgi:hypothetical protein
MNHHGLFIKLMNKMIPSKILTLLEHWFNHSITCVKWGTFFSDFFTLTCGIRQGGVLSPYLFAIYIDGVADRVRLSKTGCYIKMTCVSSFLYADDILLLAPSVNSLQQLLRACEQELGWLDMTINLKKSACMRIGNRFNTSCENITTIDGCKLNWTNSIRYLGVYISSSTVFHCLIDNAKRSFYRSFNAIYGKIGNTASEETIIELLKMKCLPSLYYGMEACPLNLSQINSLNFAIISCIMKVFRTNSKLIASECMSMFNVLSVTEALARRKKKFLAQYCDNCNSLCQLFSDVARRELMHIT